MTGKPPASDVIELRLNSLEQLFDPFDPFPIPTRDLARGAEDFIVGWAQELPARAALQIGINLPGPANAAESDSLRAAVAGHFLYRARRTRSDMHELLTIAQVSLGIGLAVLAACTGLRQLLHGLVPAGAISGFLTEGLVIVGWVANWRPIEILLYEWWPLSRRRRLFERLAAAQIDLRAGGAANAQPLDAGQGTYRGVV
jgi:hypothetical protein